MDEVPDAPVSRRKLLPLRVAVYVLLLLGGLAWVRQIPIDPYRDYEAVVDAAVAAEGKEQRFHEGAAFLFMIPEHGYVLTLAVYPDRERFPKADFLIVVSDVNGDPIRCALQVPSSTAGMSVDHVMEGEAMREYLQQVDIDLAPLKALQQRHYR